MAAQVGGAEEDPPTEGAGVGLLIEAGVWSCLRVGLVSVILASYAQQDNFTAGTYIQRLFIVTSTKRRRRIFFLA